MRIKVLSHPLTRPQCRFLLLSLLLLVAVLLVLFRGIPLLLKPSILSQVQQAGELVVVTRNSPTTFYEGPQGPTGFEYDLAKMFADSLGVKLRMITPDNLNDMFNMLETGKAQLAAAGLTITRSRQQRFRFGPSYQRITEQLVYNNMDIRPESPDDLLLGNLEVVANSSHVESLEKLRETQEPDLTWQAHDDMDSEELLQLVNDQVIDYTVADSNEVALNQRFLIELRVAFDVSQPRQLAWAFPKTEDSSLYDRAMSFFWRVLNNGEITHLIEKHYGHVTQFDYVGNRIFLRHIATRLSKYKDIYQQAANEYQLDWKLLASMGYQESHWNPRAVSPTGVRGIMMLTLETAGQLGIKNRLDPESSIRGGARYLDQIRQRFPEEISEPDRTWYALAAYNVGYYHVLDAQKLALDQGKDPNKWVDLKTTLPLLSKRKWYRKTRYGYARGMEPVKYVENIRHYYDLLDYQLSQQASNPVEDNASLDIMPSGL